MASIVAKIAAIATLLLATSVSAEAQDGPAQLAKQLAPARGGTKLYVTSRAVGSDRTLDERFSQDGENASLPLSWLKGPAGTQSYAIVVECSRADHAGMAHWIIYNLPSTTTEINGALPKQASLDTGAVQGQNLLKQAGYIGPKPLAGQRQQYHFQVFALNTRLKLDPAETDRDDIVQAMRGRVLASGDFVVNYTGK